MKIKHIFASAIISALLCACGHPSVPTDAKQESRMPYIIPDYTEVTIPSNLCPTNFAVNENASEVVARLTVGNISYTYGEGQKVMIDESEWAELRDAAKGGSIKVEVFAKLQDGNWHSYNAFNIYVAEEEIDQYISYRLIQPSYVAYEKLSINQRDVTTFDESEIYNNMMVSTEADGQCINCHSYQNYHTDRMLFHMRQTYGGTIIVDNGSVKKMNLKTEETISAGVYPAWHPTENLVAFSTNKTGQSFHTKDLAKIEVQDTRSDLILYDVERDEICNVEADSAELEVFPTWSPDGKTLYYCSAHFEYLDSTQNHEAEMIKRFKECKYDLYRKSFDPKSRQFGERELIYLASDSTIGHSATLPRVSPDGRYLVFAEGNFGCFHIWHPEADIQCIDLKTNEKIDVSLINSNRAESYPSFSSNGRWLMMESRRDDSNYTRTYIAYFDKQGKARKAFALPQRDPHFYTYFMRSYNRPEFMVEPVKVSPQEFASAARTDAKGVTFKR